MPIMEEHEEDDGFGALAEALRETSSDPPPRSGRLHPFESDSRMRAASSAPPPPVHHERRRLRVSADGESFDLDGRRIDCAAFSDDPALPRVLEQLATARATRPGVPVTIDELIQAGFPGERMSRIVARARIAATLLALSEHGLEGILQARAGDGHLLSTEIDFALGLSETA